MTEEKKQKKKNKEELQAEIETLKEDYMRLQADFTNYRRRMEEEMNKARDKAISSFVIDLLPAIDHFEMSLKMSNNQEMFIKGVEMIHSNLLETLKSHKIEQFEPKINSEFDLKEHEPVRAEEGEPGKVLEVLRKGYKHTNNILRPARVKIKGEETKQE